MGENRSPFGYTQGIPRGSKARASVGGRRCIAFSAAIAALTAAAVAGAAAENLDEKSVYADPQERIVIENSSGAVTVMGWDLSELRYGGTSTNSGSVIELAQGPSTLALSVAKRDGTGASPQDIANVVAAVPSKSNLSISSTSASIRVDGVGGNARVSTVNGSVFVTAKADAPGQGVLRVDTVSGSVEVEGRYADVGAETVDGDIVVAGRVPVLTVQTTSGRIRVEDDGIESAEISSISGAVEVWYRPRPGSAIKVHVVSGSLLFHIPKDVGPKLIVTSLTGTVDARGLIVNGRALAPTGTPDGKSLVFTLGNGDSVAELSSYTGAIVVFNQDTAPIPLPNTPRSSSGASSTEGAAGRSSVGGPNGDGAVSGAVAAPVRPPVSGSL